MTAAEAMNLALLGMAERGERPRCGDGETSGYWTSEAADERLQAARWCSGCPITEECRAFAEELKPTWSVFAGQDFSPIKTKRTTTHAR